MYLLILKLNLEYPSDSYSTCVSFKQSAVGLELWTMSDNILFDNLLITDDIVVAQEIAAVTFDLKRKQMDIDSVRF